MLYKNIREEELKNKITADYFTSFDCTKILGDIDFCVSLKEEEEISETEFLLWAEAKKGKAEIVKSIVQLILTIGKARTFDTYLPPAFLAAFDAEKIAFIPYNTIQEIFYLNDFNWNITPSNHKSKEFKQVEQKVQAIIEENSLLFYFDRDSKELHEFIRINFVLGKSSTSKIQIDKNNFISIYIKWLETVKPTIAVNWDIAKKIDIIDGDFYLADLLSRENETLKEKLYVLLKKDRYQLDRKLDDMGMFNSKEVSFIDKQKAHKQFWNKYKRPPKKSYWDYIVERRDLLVPQDVRERKGSFFTPQIWVELSQKYLADTLGEDWQDEYYIWDCAAGTGNLLAGLNNKYNIWASTLDRQDVDVMQDRIKNGANLLEKHVFQFDFLNDSFDKLPKPLFEIINNPEKRKKLVIYINPPYVESNGRISKTRSNIQETNIHAKYAPKLKQVAPELFAQFLARIYFEIPDCIIAQFSTLKVISATNSKTFRNHFLAKLEKLFIVPADTFDNVKGKFPIGFFIWDTSKKEKFEKIKADVFASKAVYLQKKKIYAYDIEKGRINNWLSLFKNNKEAKNIGILVGDAPDFQNNNFVSIQNKKGIRHALYFPINETNLREASIYLSVRHSIKATWLNDRDQFLFPKRTWKKDTEFQNDCLTYAIFHGQNKISSEKGTNHWQPFTEHEINAQEKFESNFMTNFIAGKLKPTQNGDLLGSNKPIRTIPLEFSSEAQTVFEAGKNLWKYYHKEANCNVNASLYDIRAYFQGRTSTGRMNNKSNDEIYMKHITAIRENLKVLAQKIDPKVYEYGFLKK